MSEKHESITNKSSNSLLIGFSLFAFALFIVLAQISSNMNPTSTREPASLDPQPKLNELKEKHSVHQKIKPPILVKIEKENLGKVYAGSEFEVVASISSEVDTKNVNVEWSLPAYVEVVSGETFHTFDTLKSNEEKQVRIVLKSLSDENQQIHITASAPYGKQILSSVDQFNTTFEQELKEAKAALVQRNLEYTGK